MVFKFCDALHKTEKQNATYSQGCAERTGNNLKTSAGLEIGDEIHE